MISGGSIAKEGTVALPDGRSLGWSEFGAADGIPVFYFHGWPSSRLEGAFLDEPARQQGIRILALDRPGFGLSSHQEDRRIVDWPFDVARVADALGIDEFRIVGMSGGAPYAAACGASLPDRVRGVALVSGLGPLNAPECLDGMDPGIRLFFVLAKKSPWILELQVGVLAKTVAKAERGYFFLKVLGRLSKPDRLLETHERNVWMDSRIYNEAFRSGTAGPLHDARLAVAPWGIDLGGMKIPVRIWHGELDYVDPPAMGRILAERIAGARSTFVAYEGHFSLAVKQSEAILSDLKALGRQRDPGPAPSA